MQVLTVNYSSATAKKQFCESLKETGFAVLEEHPISTQLIEDVYQQWQQFFFANEKLNYLYQKPAQDGYFPFKSENAKNSKTSDLKEFFHFYPWGKKPPALQAATMQLYRELTQLAAQLLQWIEDYLPTAVSQSLSMPLRDMVDLEQNTLLRILHYPPLQNNSDLEAVRAAPHEDINLITLLPSATAPGLEVLDQHKQWHAITCNPNNIVVNVGDMLQMCTQQYYKSTTHRVVNPSSSKDNTSRFSMPLFLHARKDVRLSDEYTVIEYLHERLRQIGIY